MDTRAVVAPGIFWSTVTRQAADSTSMGVRAWGGPGTGREDTHEQAGQLSESRGKRTCRAHERSLTSLPSNAFLDAVMSECANAPASTPGIRISATTQGYTVHAHSQIMTGRDRGRARHMGGRAHSPRRAHDPTPSATPNTRDPSARRWINAASSELFFDRSARSLKPAAVPKTRWPNCVKAQ